MKSKVFELSSVDLTLYKFVLPLMKELRQHGFDVICGARNYGYLDKLEQQGFKTYDIEMTRSLNPIALLKSLTQLVSVFKKEEIEILHVHTPIASIVGRLAAFFARVNIKIYTVHGFIVQPKLFYYVEKFMAKRFTDYMFTVNQEDLDLTIQNKFISASKALNINSVGIDIDHFNPDRVSEAIKNRLRGSFNIKKDIQVIGYVGRMVKSKGVLDLVQAFTEIKKEIDCKLLLVGPWDFSERADDVIIEDVRSIIQENQLEQDILLPGHREDIADLLSIMDIFVLPSYREGMPVSLLEAMAMEKAVIGTDIRGVREEINMGSGLIYQPNDVEGLKNHIKFYLNNSTEAQRFGLNARQRVVKEFRLDRVIEKQMKIFLELSNDGKR